jgi:hypothetical protein
MQIICLELFFEITKLMIYDIMAFKPSFIFRPTLPMYGLKAITKYHRLGGLLTTKRYFSQFWRLEVTEQSSFRPLPNASRKSLCQDTFITQIQKQKGASIEFACIATLMPSLILIHGSERQFSNPNKKSKENAHKMESLLIKFFHLVMFDTK